MAGAVKYYEGSIAADAGKEIYRLAALHKLDHTELSRECKYTGVVNGQQICVSVFDRDPVADLNALRSAILAAEQSHAA
jgi:hypothetical protein